MENYLNRLSGDLRLINVGVFFEILLKQKNVSSRSIAKSLGVPYRSFRNYLCNKRAMPLGIALGVIKILSNGKKQQKILSNKLFNEISWIKSTASTAKSVKLPKRFSKELGYLIGAIHDGTVFANESKNQYVIQYWQFSDKNWLNIVAEKLERVFACKPRMYKSYIQLASKAAYEFFAKVIRIRQRQCDWNSFLISLPEEFRQYAIAGMFDAEGWIGSPKDLRLKFSQNNKEKLAEVKNVLYLQGISSGEVIHENNGYALWLCGKNCIDFAKKFVSFSEHRNKREKLNRLSLLHDG